MPRRSSDRAKPPAWLRTGGSRNARSGAKAKPARGTVEPAREEVVSRAHTTAPASRPASATPTPRGRRASTNALSENARVVLERRYLARDGRGKVIETAEQLFRRVAHDIALAEAQFVPSNRAKAAISDAEKKFYDLISSLRFLPNSPTLGNAGRPLQQLSACFVLPVEDSIDRIFDTIKHAALIHQTGGGTGFAFSRLRPEGSMVRSTAGVASGPVSFMKVFDSATEAIKPGSARPGANLGIHAGDTPEHARYNDCQV